MSKYTDQDITERYQKGEGIQSIAESYDLHYITIQRRLKKVGMFVKNSTYKLLNKIPLSLFMDKTPERDYWIGWILSDGNIIYNKTGYLVKLATKDKEIVDKYNQWLSGKGNIFYRDYADLYIVHFGQKEIVKYLVSIGLTPKKSKTLSFGEELNWDIVRGVFDGDGCIRKGRNECQITSGSPAFLQQLSDFLTKEDIKHNIRPKDKTNTCWDLCMSSRPVLTSLFEKMYNNCRDLKLNRKYQRFIEQLNIKL
jgi:hypothetical protein